MSEVPLYGAQSSGTRVYVRKKTAPPTENVMALGARPRNSAPTPCLRFKVWVYRGTSLTRKRLPLEPYRRPMPGVLGGS